MLDGGTTGGEGGGESGGDGNLSVGKGLTTVLPWETLGTTPIIMWAVLDSLDVTTAASRSLGTGTPCD